MEYFQKDAFINSAGSVAHCARDGLQNKMAVCEGTCSLHLDVVTAHYHSQKTKKEIKTVGK